MLFKEVITYCNSTEIYFDYGTKNSLVFWIYFEINELALNSYVDSRAFKFNCLTEVFEITS
jgi:hypothetical protein